MRDICLALLMSVLIFMAVKVNSPVLPGEDLATELESCRTQLELLQLERGIVGQGANLASQLANIAHSHGQICRRAYLACGVEEPDERQQGEADQAAGVRRDGGGLPEGR